jgi:hypothetical protein
MHSQKSQAEAEMEAAISVTKMGQKSVSRTRRGRYRRISGSELVEVVVIVLVVSLSSIWTAETPPSPPPGDSGGWRISSRR